MDLTNALVQGILLGGLYALFATGLSLIFGVMRLVNLAHGDFGIVAAFLALSFVSSTGISVWMSLGLVVPAMALLGYILQRSILQRALSGGPLPIVLVTFGLSIVIQNVLLSLYSADEQRLHIGTVETASLSLGGISAGKYPLFVFILAIVVIASLGLFLQHTTLGRIMRATRDDQEAARLSGVDNRHIYGVAAALAFATVAVAGVLSGVQTSFSPTSGPLLLLFAFEAVIVGGLGSLWGTLAGGIVMGVAQSVGAWVDPAHQVLIGHLVFLAVLAFRPQGLFGKAGMA
jgi:branched-chain amino acid transport system permease protein